MNILTPVQQKFVEEFSKDPDIIKLVKDTESKPATTQNHYGDYGAALSSLSKGRKGAAQLLGLAFIKAGANQTGVLDALNTMF